MVARYGAVVMRRIRVLIFVFLASWAAAAQAQIEIAFYSKDMASSFPHAYVRLTGIDEQTGQQVDTNYGFTPVSLGPGVLFGNVRGMIESATPLYVQRSDRHFALKLTDAQYRQVLAIVDKWRTAKQPSYNLNKRNCITFVAEVAIALGLKAPVLPKLMKKPKSYLNVVTEMNSALISHWPGSTLANSSPPALAADPSKATATAH
jgi:hypothetical protein